MTPEAQRPALERATAELSYPALRSDAAAALEGETIVVEDREVPLGAAITDLDVDAFATPEHLLSTVDALAAGEDPARTAREWRSDPHPDPEPYGTDEEP